MKLEGAKISISRTTSSEWKEDKIHISIVDEKSGVEFLDAYMDLADFGACIAGASFRPFHEITVRPEKLGKTREHKTEFVPIKYSGYNRESRKKEAKTALRKFEVDGWKARRRHAEYAQICASRKEPRRRI